MFIVSVMNISIYVGLFIMNKMGSFMGDTFVTYGNEGIVRNKIVFCMFSEFRLRCIHFLLILYEHQYLRFVSEIYVASA